MDKKIERTIRKVGNTPDTNNMQTLLPYIFSLTDLTDLSWKRTLHFLIKWQATEDAEDTEQFLLFLYLCFVSKGWTQSISSSFFAGIPISGTDFWAT